MERLAPDKSTSPETELSLKDPDKHHLLRYGYDQKLSKSVRTRRQAIKKAIRKDSFDSVYRKLEDLKDELNHQYKKKRLEEDLNWLKSNHQRYVQTIF